MDFTAIPVFCFNHLLFHWTRIDRWWSVCVSAAQQCLSIDEGLEDVWNAPATNWMHSVPAVWAHCVPLFTAVMPVWSLCLPTLSVLLDPCPVNSDSVCMWHPDITQGRKTQWAKQWLNAYNFCHILKKKKKKNVTLASNSCIFRS